MKEKSEAEKRVMKKKQSQKEFVNFLSKFFADKDTSIFKQSHFTEIVGRFKSQFFVNSEYNTSEDQWHSFPAPWNLSIDSIAR